MQIDLFGEGKMKTTAGPEKKKRRALRAPRVVISVSESEINTAVRNHSSHCMIADAIKRQMPDVKSVSVDIQTIRWSDPKLGLRYTYLTPRESAVALVKFDQGEPVKPFSFRLRGAQVTTMSKGRAGKQKPRHNLGKRRLVATPTEKKDGIIPDVVGGRPPPRFGARREFGMRRLSLVDVYGDPGK